MVERIALLGSARWKRLQGLLQRLDGRGEQEVIVTQPYPTVSNDASQPLIRIPATRFSATAAAPLAGRYDTAAIPYSHANPERHEYLNVERFATALGVRRIIRFYAHDRWEEVDAPSLGELEIFHRRAVDILQERREKRLEELAAFTGETLVRVEARVQQAEAVGIERWLAAPPRTDADVQAFYRDQDFYLYQLTKANFYRGGRTEYIEDVIRHLEPGMRILEFGCGVGEVSLELSRLGHDVTAMDINRRQLAFIQSKAVRRGLSLCVRETLPDPAFDAVLAFDVLEHVWDVEATLTALLDRLRGKRLLLMRLPDDDEELPLHFKGRRSTVEALLAERGFHRVATATDMDAYAS